MVMPHSRLSSPPILLLKEGDHDQHHSALEKWRIVASTLLVLRRRGAMVATLILRSSAFLLLITWMVWPGSPLSSFQRRGGKVVMPHSVMAKPNLLLKGRRQASYGLLILRERGHGCHLMAFLFLKGGWKVTMTNIVLLLSSRGL